LELPGFMAEQRRHPPGSAGAKEGDNSSPPRFENRPDQPRLTGTNNRCPLRWISRATCLPNDRDGALGKLRACVAIIWNQPIIAQSGHHSMAASPSVDANCSSIKSIPYSVSAGRTTTFRLPSRLSLNLLIVSGVTTSPFGLRKESASKGHCTMQAPHCTHCSTRAR
jgi:hypothetical protein